jgi:large subunit ribosomal protein L22
MAFTAKHRYARISPRKARLLMDLIRGRQVDDALTLLRFSKKRASVMVEKVVRSAVANATEQDVAPKRSALVVSAAWVDEGPTIKRFQPKDRGKAYSIKKRTSHLVVEVDAQD